jgi:hypothetical protein
MHKGAAAVGAILGAAAAALGLWVGRSPEPTAVEVAAPDTVPPAVAPAVPVLLGPTELVPIGLALEGREVVFSYELVDNAPPSAAFVFADTEVPVVAPELWTLATAAGAIEGATANARAAAARFPVPEGFTLDQVSGVTLEAYRIRLPITIDVDLAWDATDPVAVDGSVAVGVRRVLEQASSTLVQLTVEDGGDAFTAAGGAFGASFEAGPRVLGRGPGWTNVGPATGGVQLTFVGDLPDPFGVTVTTSSWTRVLRPTPIGVGGLIDD